MLVLGNRNLASHKSLNKTVYKKGKKKNKFIANISHRGDTLHGFLRKSRNFENSKHVTARLFNPSSRGQFSQYNMWGASNE